MSQSSEIDPELYKLAYEFLCAKKTGERRKRAREPFPAIQRIAPYSGSGVPDEKEFFEVRCRDISNGGVSFLTPGRPDFDSLVIGFTTAPDTITYIAAEVAHCTDVLVYPSGRVQPASDRTANSGCTDFDDEAPEFMVQVGCRFTQRLELTDDRP
jgi:hypothetical protein